MQIVDDTYSLHHKPTHHDGYGYRHHDAQEQVMWEVPLHVVDSWAKRQDSC